MVGPAAPMISVKNPLGAAVLVSAFPTQTLPEASMAMDSAPEKECVNPAEGLIAAPSGESSVTLPPPAA